MVIGCCDEGCKVMVIIIVIVEKKGLSLIENRKMKLKVVNVIKVIVKLDI